MSRTPTRSGGAANALRGLRAATAPAAKTALLRLGGYAAMRRLWPSRQLAILRYHAVCEPDAGYADPSICVTPAAFRRHVACLAAGYRVLPLPDAVAALRRGATLPANAVAITFDDGYADNLEAARVLARHGLTATFYLTAGCLAGGAPFWPAELRQLVQVLPGPAIELRFDGQSLTLPVTDTRSRAAAISTLTHVFKRHPIPVRESLRDQLRQLAGPVPAHSPMLRWTDVVEMQRLGMVIGSHTMTHPNLPSAGLRDAEVELRESKRALESAVAAPVTMFSYPNGGADRYMTPEIARLVREAGFDAATTSRNAFAGPHSDPYALERIQVSERLEDLLFALEVERFAFKPQPRPLEASR